jgi:hypothetical protein
VRERGGQRERAGVDRTKPRKAGQGAEQSKRGESRAEGE